MEYFDIVDEIGNPTGEIVERSDAHKNGIRHRTAHIWLVRKHNGNLEVLLQKRADNKDSFPGCYDTSSAGHIHAGDTPLDSALRELSEELGVNAQKEDLKFAGKFIIKYEKEFYGKLFKDNEITFLYVLYYDQDISKLTLQKEEVSEVKWFEVEYLTEAIKNKDKSFCVPIDGFNLAKKWCKENLK